MPNGTPINDLPTELLSSVFVLVFNASLYARSIGDPSYSSIDYPTLLSSICSRWRRVALGTPHLWSYLDFATAGTKLQNLRLVNRCFERSLRSPLFVRIGQDKHECLSKSVEEKVASILQASASRLHSLAISYWYNSFTKEAMSIIFSQRVTVPIRQLALFAVSGNGRIVSDPDLISQDYIDKLLEPLHTLHLESVSPDWDKVPCRNLIELQLVDLPASGFPTVEQLLYLLRTNPKLRSLKLARFHMAPKSPKPPKLDFDPIQLPALQKLELHMSPNFIDWFLNLLVPSPHELGLYLASWPVPTRPDVIKTLISLSKRTQITTLHIAGDWLSLSSIYGSLPYLRTLILSGQLLFESDFAGLYGAAHLWSCLHTVDIVACADSGGIQYGVRAMSSLPSLRRIRFRNCSFFEDGEKIGPDDIVRWLSRECANDQVDISDSPELDFRTHESLLR